MVWTSRSAFRSSARQTGRNDIEFWLRLIGVRKERTLIVGHTWDDLAGPAIEWGQAQARSMAANI